MKKLFQIEVVEDAFLDAESVKNCLTDPSCFFHSESDIVGVEELTGILNASEAVYGFAAWLTCKKEAVTFGANHEAGIAAELVAEFCKVNNLPEVGPDWPINLIHPSGEIAVAGRGKNADEAQDPD
jgi:hypothetical protein